MGHTCFFIGHRDTGAEIFPALSDARSVLSIAISHNMDNINPIGQGDLAKYMGLTKTVGGTNSTDPNRADAVADASNSKRMTVTTNNPNEITYLYRRGGVTLQGVINVADQTITWTVNGLNGNTNRLTAIREGLKLATDADLTENTSITW